MIAKAQHVSSFTMPSISLVKYSPFSIFKYYYNNSVASKSLDSSTFIAFVTVISLAIKLPNLTIIDNPGHKAGNILVQCSFVSIVINLSNLRIAKKAERSKFRREELRSPQV